MLQNRPKTEPIGVERRNKEQKKHHPMCKEWHKKTFLNTFPIHYFKYLPSAEDISIFFEANDFFTTTKKNQNGTSRARRENVMKLCMTKRQLLQKKHRELETETGLNKSDRKFIFSCTARRQQQPRRILDCLHRTLFANVK